jgi:ABC-type dipeptide/oligopeptide/nickel transport system permease subunit
VIHMETEKKKPSSTIFNLKRFASFMKIFLRNRRATFGLFIILFFVFISIAAPLLTPFTPLGEDPTRAGAVAGRYVAPTWLRFFPSWLGGMSGLSENMEPVKDPGLAKPWPEGAWNLSVVPVDHQNSVGTQFSPDLGYPNIVQGFTFPNKNGSLAITFQRPQGSVLNETKAYVFTDFDYPYSGPPERLIANFELLVNGTYFETLRPTEQWYIIRVKVATRTPTVGNLIIGTSSSSGLYLEASTDITEYFGKIDTWTSLGYKSWKEWLNGTNTLPGHGDQMKWVASEGSLTNQTENVQVKNWTTTTTLLTNASKAGGTRIYVSSTTGFNQAYAYLTIGSNETEEANQVIAPGPNYIDLKNPLKYDHDENETVMLTAQTITLFENLTVSKGQDLYVLVKATTTHLYDVYTLDVQGATHGGISGAGVYDENYEPDAPNSNRVDPWTIYVRYVRLQVPIKVRIFLGSADKEISGLTTLFPVGAVVPQGFFVNATTLEPSIAWPLSGESSNGYWILSRYSPDSAYPLIDIEKAADLLNMFQPAPGRYRFGMEITFVDTGFPNENVSTTVYLDDLALRTFGTSYGLLGSDQYGRDLFSQLIYGTRISLYLGILVALVSVSIGLTVGLVAGYVGGAADQLLMRFNDLMLVLPGLPLMIVLVAVLGARVENLIVLLGFLGWNGFARLVRSQVLSLKERPFIEAAKAAGANTGHIIMRHILPHVMALVYISLATAVPGAITAEAALSFLGFYDPSRMSWGRMLHEVFAASATKNWWWIIPPGLCIALIAMAFILLGFALDEILNPKLRQRR